MGEEPISEAEILDRLEDIQEAHREMIDAAEEAGKAEEKPPEQTEKDLDELEAARKNLEGKLDEITDAEMPDEAHDLADFLEEMSQDIEIGEGQDQKFDTAEAARDVRRARWVPASFFVKIIRVFQCPEERTNNLTIPQRQSARSGCTLSSLQR